MGDRIVDVYGLHGSSHIVPPDTIAAYWAALGEGAKGIVACIHLNKSGRVICCPSAVLPLPGGVSRLVLALSDEEIRQYDAGVTFPANTGAAIHAQELNCPKAHPWIGNPEKNDHLYYPNLTEVLQLFGRRTRMLLKLGENQGEQAATALVDKTLTILRTFGLTSRVTIIASERWCSQIHERAPDLPLALIPEPDERLEDSIDACRKVGATYLFTTIENIAEQCDTLTSGLSIDLLITSNNTPHALSFQQHSKLASLECDTSLCFRNVAACIEMTTPPGLVLSDNFEGGSIDQSIWACGYSHQNQDTQISQNNGLIIEIAAGGSYSGGAAVTILPIHGRFDAQVDFFVEAPQQGTTFELAAIGIDPGYFRIDNQGLNSTNVNLTFDVHGAPPYASAERDEDDGFRIGWNNGYNLTKTDPDWRAASVNMYNKYSRDVGDAAADNQRGTLRLVRNGPVFNSYYKDRYNPKWMCSGSALVPNLGEDVHIRLAAKHWKKRMPTPPANKVVFTNFRLYQF